MGSRERVLLLTGETVYINVPAPIPGVQEGVVKVMLSPSGDVQNILGLWEFSVAFRDGEPCLALSASRLDQCFVTLNHGTSSPVATEHQLVQLPEGVEELSLYVETVPSHPDSIQGYRLRWGSKAEAKSVLATWRLRQVPPIQWFYVELTTHCNLACPFCPSRTLKRPRAFMDPKLANRVFKEIADYLSKRDMTVGYTRIDRMVFLHAMGEPLLHPKFSEIVAAAMDYDLVTALFTNATLLNENNITKIFDSGITHVTLSINVVTSEGYQGLGTRDEIEKQERRVINFLRCRAERGAMGIHVDIQYLATGRNVVGEGLLNTKEQVWKLFRFWLLIVRNFEKRFMSALDPVPLVEPWVMANPLRVDDVEPSICLPLAHGVNLVIKSGCSFGNAVLPHKMTVIPTRQGMCPFGNPFHQIVIFVDGSVSFCNIDHDNSVALGNIQEQSIESIWNGSRMCSIRAGMASGILTEPVCQRCLGTVIKEQAKPHVNNYNTLSGR
jgi:pyruvate-formate lyase-activating enzyme